MASKNQQCAAIRDELGGDYTVSMIGGAYDALGGDKQKIIEYFKSQNACEDQARASIDDTVQYLRQVMAIEGIPDSMYRECVEKANGNLSDAFDILEAESKKFLSNKHSPSKAAPPTNKGPTASPIVSPPVYNGGAAKPLPAKPADKPLPSNPPADKPVPEKPADKPLPEKPADKPLPEKPADKPLPEKPADKPLPEKPADKPLPEKPSDKPLPSNPPAAKPVLLADVDVDDDDDELDSIVPGAEPTEQRIRRKSSPVVEEAMQKEAEYRMLLEKQEKEAAERKRVNEEMEARLAQIAEKKKSIENQKQAEGQTNEELEEELHRYEIEEAVIRSSMVVKEVPDYQKGRLPTKDCVISVTVCDKEISFTWKIPEDVETHPKDWIGLYIHDRQYSNKYENYVALGGKHEGVASFTAPTIGYFDLRYYQNNGSEEKSRSKEFLVGPEMKVEAMLQGRRKIAVSWDRSAETTEGDWVALYPVSTYSNTQYIKWIPVSEVNSDGVVFFDAPRQPGEYEVRYFFTSKRHATGYAYSGKSKPIVIPNEDEMEVIDTHPVVKVRWQTFSQEPRRRDWVGLYASSDPKAKRLGWEYLSTKGLMDDVGDHGIAEIECETLIHLDKSGELPEDADKWEVRLFNAAPNQPFLRAPFLKPH